MVPSRLTSALATRQGPWSPATSPKLRSPQPASLARDCDSRCAWAQATANGCIRTRSRTVHLGIRRAYQGSRHSPGDFDGDEFQSYCFLEVARYQAVAVMDTMTYASVAALPWSVAQSSKYRVIPEPEFLPFNLSYIDR
jgi:hypothetical protein